MGCIVVMAGSPAVPGGFVRYDAAVVRKGKVLVVQQGTAEMLDSQAQLFHPSRPNMPYDWSKESLIFFVRLCPAALFNCG